MTGAGRGWRAVLLAISSGAAGLLAMAVAASAALYAVFGHLLKQPNTEPQDVLAVFLVCTSVAFIGALLLTTAYRASGVLRGQPDPSITTSIPRLREVSLLLALWIASSAIAQIVAAVEGWRWLAPLLHLLAIGAPVYLLLRLGIGGIRGGSRLRLWGILATGLVLGTGLAAAVEIGLLVLGISVGSVYLLLNPDRLHAFQSLVLQLGQISRPEEMLPLLESWLARPFTLLLILAAVSGVAPIVEELAKSTAAWLVYDRLSTRAQGFWCGALSGAGFAFFEGLVASTDASQSWAFILLVRGASSLMHILASALVGWGIAAWRQSGKVAHLLGGYAVGIGLHALWNASIVALAFGGFRLVNPGSDLDVLGLVTGAAGGLGLLALLTLMPLALFVLNRRLRSPLPDLAARTPGPDSQQPIRSLED